MDQNGTSRSTPAGNGLQWIIDGFNLFKKNFGIWIAIFVILVVGSIVVGLVPIAGHVALLVINPILVGGIMLGCKALDEGGELEVAHLFAGFQKNTTQLFLIGIFYLVATVIIIGAIVATMGGVLFAGLSGHINNAGSVTGILLALLIGLALFVPVWMAIWFAPALVVIDNMNAAPALKRSFNACLKNIVPFLVYGILAFVLSILAAIPLLLGYLVLVPVMMASIYTSYRDIFQKTS